ncbi:hypothetical protein HFP72_27660 [Nocardiopsis sp. ARC36]
MSDLPLVGARRFEAYMRWSTYFAVSIPMGTLLRSAIEADGLTGAPLAALVTALVLSLVLFAGNILVVNWSIDTLVGRERRLLTGGVIAWALVLVAFVSVTFLIPLPAMGMTVAAAIGSAAASFVPSSMRAGPCCSTSRPSSSPSRSWASRTSRWCWSEQW